jgi:hypothetical protein
VPSTSVPRLIVEYDDDAAGAADALLAVLRHPRATTDPDPDENDDNEETAA